MKLHYPIISAICLAASISTVSAKAKKKPAPKPAPLIQEGVFRYIDPVCQTKVVTACLVKLNQYPGLRGNPVTDIPCSHPRNQAVIKNCMQTFDLNKISAEIQKSIGTAFLTMLLKNDSSLEGHKKELEKILDEMNRLVPDGADQSADEEVSDTEEK